jgi:ATP-binding cassette, subfamily C, bacterial exporter for protease/lipase
MSGQINHPTPANSTVPPGGEPRQVSGQVSQPAGSAATVRASVKPDLLILRATPDADSSASASSEVRQAAVVRPTQQAPARAPAQDAFGTYGEALAAIRPALVWAFVFSGLLNVLLFAGPIFMLQVYDRVLASGSSATLFGLFVILFAAYAFFGIYSLLRSRVLSVAAYRLDSGLSARALAETMVARRSGSKVEAGPDPIRELAILRQFVAGGALPALFDLPWAPLFVVVVTLIHPVLGGLTIAGAAIVTVAAVWNHRATRKPLAENAGLESSSLRFAASAQRDRDLIQAYGMAGDLGARWTDDKRKSLFLLQKVGNAGEPVSAFSKAFRQFLQSALLGGGAYYAIQGAISPGMIIAVSILASRALQPIDQIVGQWSGISRAHLAHRALTASLGQPLRQKDDGFALPQPLGQLTLTNATVLAPSAGGEPRRLLQEVGFELEPGAGLAVVGRSGSGKSTLLRVLAGALVPDQGQVLLDGATYDQWPGGTLGKHVGWLPQRVDFLPGTVAENIARFAPDARDDAVVHAAKVAGVHELILSLPRGYSTMLGTPDQPLSTGQAQRLGLARAIYGNPALVILDEPNAALDAVGEEALKKLIRHLRKCGTTVVAAVHRASIVDTLDLVLILNEGKVSAFGPRAKLVAATVARDSVPVPAHSVKS